MTRKTLYGTLTWNEEFNENEQSMLYIKECAESVGLEIIEGETAFSITFMAEIMRRLRKNQEPSGDAISRQAAIDTMYALCDTGETLKENPWRDNPHIDAITDALDNLQSVTLQPKTVHWISVSERLPEDEVEVLIYTTDNKINKAYRRHKSWTENQKEWLVFETIGYDYIYDDDEVLAWMPLPKPYESQESEDAVKHGKSYLEPKTGKWIEERTHMECPNCHDIWHYEENQTERFKCCPTCGERNEYESKYTRNRI